ncbi:MAG: cytochrome c oxidase assembly protein [Geminicoccaceae bacterium]
MLGAGQSADLPVSFFVDPAILDDPDTRDLQSITLSYTFFPHDEQADPEATDDRPSS